MQSTISDAQQAEIVERHQWWRRYDPFVLRLLAAELGPATLTRSARHPIILCRRNTDVARVWVRRLAWKPGTERHMTLRLTDRRFTADSAFSEFGQLFDGHGAAFLHVVNCAKTGPLRVYDWALYDLHLVRRWLDAVAPCPELVEVNPLDGNQYLRIPARLLPADAYRLNASTFTLAP